MPGHGWTKMGADEVRLARKWYQEERLSISKIAERLGRHKSVLSRLLVKQVPRKAQGRPQALTEAQVDFLARRLDELVKKADCRDTVTAKMLQRAARVYASERAIQRALRQTSI